MFHRLKNLLLGECPHTSILLYQTLLFRGLKAWHCYFIPLAVAPASIVKNPDPPTGSDVCVSFSRL